MRILATGAGHGDPSVSRPSRANSRHSTDVPIANTMVNGKDFFLELRKQVTSLQQGGNVAGG